MKKRTLNTMNRILEDISNCDMKDIKRMKELLKRSERLMKQLAEQEEAKEKAYIELKPKRKIHKVKKIENIVKVPKQLCLPEPKEIIDILVDELNHFMREDFLKRPEVIADIELFSKKFKGRHPWPLIPQGLDDKSKIYNILRVSNLRDDVSTIYKKLLKYYHPDHCTKDNAAELTEYLVKVYKMNFKNQQGSQSKNTPPKAKPKQQSKKTKKKVAMYKDGEYIRTFDSVAECKEYFNLNKTNTIINQCCNGRCKSYKGYSFKYIEE